MKSKGFTLLEMLLSVVVIAILAGFSLPVFRTMLTKNDLDVATVTVVQTLRRAQTQSLAVDGDTTWGVKVQSGSITLFKGASYTTRDSNFDETFEIPTAITTGGVSEIVFSRLLGQAQTTGTITLATDNDNSSVTINDKGMVSY